VAWTDNTVVGADYFALKASLKYKEPLLNLPYIQCGDTYISESVPLLRYVASLGNLIPSNNFSAFKTDQVVALANDFFDVIGFTFGIKDREELLAARAGLCAGPDGKLFQWAAKADIMVRSWGENFVCGSDLTVGDISLFVNMGIIVSGQLDGFPADFLTANFPAIAAYRARVARHPKVASRYDNIKEGNPCFKFAHAFKA
jgi:glutathione S-transferase